MHQRIRTTFGFSLQLPFVSGRESFVELRLWRVPGLTWYSHSSWSLWTPGTWSRFYHFQHQIEPQVQCAQLCHDLGLSGPSERTKRKKKETDSVGNCPRSHATKRALRKITFIEKKYIKQCLIYMDTRSIQIYILFLVNVEDAFSGIQLHLSRNHIIHLLG